MTDPPPVEAGSELRRRAREVPLVWSDEVIARHQDVSDPVFVYDPFERHAIIWGNEGGIRVWRCETLEELQARDFAEDTGVGMRFIEAQLDDFLAEGGWNFRWTLYPDGVPVVAVNNGRAMRIGDHVGVLVRVVAVDTGITPESTRMHMAAHYLSESLAVFDDGGALLMQNPAAAETYPRIDGTPRDWASRFVNPDDHARALADVQAARPHRAEVLMRTRAGDRWHAITATRSKDPATGQDAVVVQELNIERLRRAEDALREKNEQLEASLRQLRETQSQLVMSEKMAMVGRLVAGLVHEINTPLGAITSSAHTAARALEKLRSALPDDAGRLERFLSAAESAHGVIGDGAERVSGLVQTLKNYSRLDQADREEADLNDCLRQTLTLARHELSEGVTIETELGELPSIACFPRQLNQVFHNVITNALQAIDARIAERGGTGKLSIESTVREGGIEIRFVDDGIGIAPEALERLFEPGFTTKGDRVGAGLGLSMCYRIVEDHGGSIGAGSDGVGRGACVTVRLPVP